jgi:MATE family multidrug resistance protein
MWATILGNIVNVVLNYLFIYGIWIFQSWDCWRRDRNDSITFCNAWVYALYDAKGKVSAFFEKFLKNIKRSVNITLFDWERLCHAMFF